MQTTPRHELAFSRIVLPPALGEYLKAALELLLRTEGQPLCGH